MPDFLLELSEQIELLENVVARLEKNPAAAGDINDCFRTIHTVKGVANALGFMALGYLCHNTETALALYRGTKEPLPHGLIILLYEFNDALRRYKTTISTTYDDTSVEIGPLVDKMASAAVLGEGEHYLQEDLHETSPIGPQLMAASALSVTEKIGAIRVTVERLDNLLNGVGELSLLRNLSQQMAQDLSSGAKVEHLTESFNSLASGLDSVTRRLQTGVMRARMLPVGNIFKKFVRIVRDLCSQLEKEADLVITGAETELDKNLLEAVSDPLLHIIRNCVDHGVETPNVRLKAGKPRRGTIRLEARQEGNSIVLEISDDGKGIDRTALVAKAVSSGAISRERAEGLSPSQMMDLIFLPGVSTASAVTDVSGRGVGMDVVKTNINKLNGMVHIESELNKGAKIKLQVPLTLAIMPILLCHTAGTKLGFPLFSVEETTRISPSDIQGDPGDCHLMLRGEPLPVLFLSQTLQLEQEEVMATDEIGVVVVKTSVRRFGLVVDRIVGKVEILLKPLDALKGIFDPLYILGGAILGDGSVAFILDVSRLEPLLKSPQTPPTIDSQCKVSAEPEELALLFGSGGGSRLYAAQAKWIGEVSSVAASSIERNGGLKVAGKDGVGMPVMMISEKGDQVAVKRNDFYLILFRKDGREIGLLAGEMVGLQRIPRSSITTALAGKNLQGPYQWNNRPVTFLNPENIINGSLPEDEL